LIAVSPLAIPLLLGDQALLEPEPFHLLCSQRVLPFPHLQGPVSGPHLRTVPVRAEDVGGPCGGLHLFPTAFYSAAVRTEEVAQNETRLH